MCVYWDGQTGGREGRMLSAGLVVNYESWPLPQFLLLTWNAQHPRFLFVPEIPPYPHPRHRHLSEVMRCSIEISPLRQSVAESPFWFLGIKMVRPFAVRVHVYLSLTVLITVDGIWWCTKLWLCAFFFFSADTVQQQYKKIFFLSFKDYYFFFSMMSWNIRQ